MNKREEMLNFRGDQEGNEAEDVYYFSCMKVGKM